MANDICGAKTRRTGKPCTNPVVNGGKRCRMHGGRAGAPVQSGRYSKLKRRDLGELAERHGEIEGAMSMLPELALLRALTEDYINRYDEMTEALLAWHNDGKKPDAKPPRILDMADSYRLISEITKIIKRSEDIDANNAISQKEFFRLTEQMGLVVKTYVEDDETRTKISEGWNKLKF